jgi:hypothetical protein
MGGMTILRNAARRHRLAGNEKLAPSVEPAAALERHIDEGRQAFDAADFQIDQLAERARRQAVGNREIRFSTRCAARAGRSLACSERIGKGVRSGKQAGHHDELAPCHRLACGGTTSTDTPHWRSAR